MQQTVTEIMSCRFCGYEGLVSDWEEDFTHHAGAWCPDCDSFNLFNAEAESGRTYLLCLEDMQLGQSLTNKKPVPRRISPLRYPGGKSWLAPYIAAMLPGTVTRFIEPFAGGASVGLSLLAAGLVTELVLNDTDANVAAFFRQILQNPAGLMDRIMRAKPDKAAYCEYRESLLNENVPDETERAFRFLYCNRLSFSGILFSGMTKEMCKRWNPETLCRRIRRIHSMRDRITALQEDAAAVIEEEYWHGNDTFLFIDPPYYKQGKHLYRKAYGKKDHETLAWLTESLYRELPGSHMLLTYDNAEEIKKLYDTADVRIIRPAYCLARGNAARA